jgi:hypothetical protein
MDTGTKPSVVLRDAAQAAALAAKQNAAKPGVKTSEFWLAVAGAGGAAAALALLPATAGAIVSGAIAAMVIGYAKSRGDVKAAALSALEGAAAAAAGAGGTIGAIGTVVESATGATPP